MAAGRSGMVLGRLARVIAGIVLLGLAAGPAEAQTTPAGPRETIEADVSTRSISIESDFTGTRVVVFGTVENSRQTSPDENLYDLAVVIVGPRESIVARRKSNVAGLWVNTSSYRFREVPSYYAVLSTRPVKEIASLPVLYQHGIGLENMRIFPDEEIGAEDAEQFKSAVLRVKQSSGLYRQEPKGAGFIGKSLFRASVDLPANISVGEFTAWIYLFEKGDLLTTYKTRLDLQRGGFERLIYNFADQYPLLYGLAAVALALVAGFLATLAFRKN